jgi:hypothetical protein
MGTETDAGSGCDFFRVTSIMGSSDGSIDGLISTVIGTDPDAYALTERGFPFFHEMI